MVVKQSNSDGDDLKYLITGRSRDV